MKALDGFFLVFLSKCLKLYSEPNNLILRSLLDANEMPNINGSTMRDCEDLYAISLMLIFTPGIRNLANRVIARQAL
jgi:hypothetical protein